jgi:hypothetical protein
MERSTAKLEKEIFIGFFSIRKLIEAKKLSGKAFDFDKPTTTKLPVPFLCNQIIHGGSVWLANTASIKMLRRKAVRMGCQRPITAWSVEQESFELNRNNLVLLDGYSHHFCFTPVRSFTL